MGFITQGVGTGDVNLALRDGSDAVFREFCGVRVVVHGLLPYFTSQQKVVAWRCEAVSPEPIRANEDVIRRVQGEFLEMPGLRLTPAQARRLWGLDAASCDALLVALVDAKFLFRTRDGLSCARNRQRR
jgi:hypothetical protein